MSGALNERRRVISGREIARAERRFRGLTPSERMLLETVVARVVGALLAEPLRRIQSATSCDEALAYAASIDDLFALDLQVASAEARGTSSEPLKR